MVSQVLGKDEPGVLLNPLDEVVQPVVFVASIREFTKLFSAGIFHVHQREFLGIAAGPSVVGVGVAIRTLGDLTGEELSLLLLVRAPLLFLKCLFVSLVHIIFQGVLTQHILRHFQHRGCDCQVIPLTQAKSILAKESFDGLFISNGPGDPEAVALAIEIMQENK